MRTLISFVVLALVCGCAPYASNISPSPISSARYDGWNCEKLRKEQQFVEESLARVSSDQDSAASSDIWMVILIGVPTSGGGVKGEVARLKGEQIAIHEAIIAAECSSAPKNQSLAEKRPGASTLENSEQAVPTQASSPTPGSTQKNSPLAHAEQLSSTRIALLNEFGTSVTCPAEIVDPSESRSCVSNAESHGFVRMPNASAGFSLDWNSRPPKIVQVRGNAAEAGLQNGDVLSEIDRTKTQDALSALKLIGEKRPGDYIIVKVLRARKPMTFTYAMAEWQK